MKISYTCAIIIGLAIGFIVPNIINSIHNSRGINKRIENKLPEELDKRVDKLELKCSIYEIILRTLIIVTLCLFGMCICFMYKLH